MLEKLQEMEVFVAALACGAMHTHVLIRAGAADAKRIVGHAKQSASHRVRDEIPGRLWGGSSHPERIREPRAVLGDYCVRRGARR